MSVCPSPPVVSPPMRVSGHTMTAVLPLRCASIAAVRAAGDDPYITTSRRQAHPESGPLAHPCHIKDAPAASASAATGTIRILMSLDLLRLTDVGFTSALEFPRIYHSAPALSTSRRPFRGVSELRRERLHFGDKPVRPAMVLQQSDAPELYCRIAHQLVADGERIAFDGVGHLVQRAPFACGGSGFRLRPWMRIRRRPL